MNKHWQEYSDKFSLLSNREQYLILLTGLVAVIFIIFHLFIDSKIVNSKKIEKQISQLASSNETLAISKREYQAALKQDINKATREKIAQFEKKMAKVDTKLLALTSELIDPIQMRYALLELLKVKPGVSLLSFELIGAEPLLSQQELASSDTSLDKATTTDKLALDTSDAGLNLYRHGIKIKLSGNYFDLRDYLKQLEQLSWTFFWQDFNFILQEYPMNELEIEIYSLGTKEEFVGV